MLKRLYQKSVRACEEDIMADNRRINSIDIARLLAAILVVAIHTQAITWFSGYSNGSVQILTRVAVPFFFVQAVSFYIRTMPIEDSLQ